MTGYVYNGTRPEGTAALTAQATLAALRAEAARRCGLDTYPADLIARAEDCTSKREDRHVWQQYLDRHDGLDDDGDDQ